MWHQKELDSMKKAFDSKDYEWNGKACLILSPFKKDKIIIVGGL